MKIITSDYDGTLLINGKISEADLSAIEKFRHSGGIFGIVTGRGMSSITEEIKRHSIPVDFCICNNGSLIIKDGRLLDACFIDGKHLPYVVGDIIDAGGQYAAINIADRRVCAIFGENENEKEGEFFISLQNLDRIKEFNQVDARLENDTKAAALAGFINTKYGGILTAHNNGSCVDIVRSGVSKTVGIYKYLELCGKNADDLTAVGDNFNDVGMLREFGGYVLASGNPEVIKIIGRTCESVAQLIERIE